MDVSFPVCVRIIFITLRMILGTTQPLSESHEEIISGGKSIRSVKLVTNPSVALRSIISYLIDYRAIHMLVQIDNRQALYSPQARKKASSSYLSMGVGYVLELF